MTQKFYFLLLNLILAGFINSSNAQLQLIENPVPIMTLGTFHFAYPNLDALKTPKDEQIDVLQEPWQLEIMNIAKAIEQFRPTIIAVERNPSLQSYTDSLYAQYRKGSWNLAKNEIYQLGFRIASNLSHQKVYCVDDMGGHYPKIHEIFEDEERKGSFENYYMGSPYLQYLRARHEGKEKQISITEELLYSNNPENIDRSLSYYLLHPFKYEEKPGDFTGVDFETGRWFNRNLRIFRNVQRIPVTQNDRILLIIGSEHLNLLNHFFDISAEYQLVSPIPYLETL